MRQYIDDIIGEEFKNWRGGKDILISSPTGSGKTHFILNTLLPFAKSKHRTILYLCNRKILYEQINNAIFEEDRRYIQIHTYQEIEYKVRILDSYAYHIFDEAHYFFQDSIFNPRTARWYHALYDRNLRPSHARIFISATPDDLRMLLHPIHIDQYINFYFSKYTGKITETQLQDIYMPGNLFLGDCTQYSYGDFYCDKISESDFGGMKIYNMEKSYNYITCKYFNQYDELTKMIYESDKKWMIFVNKKRDGEIYCEKLNELFKGTKKTVIFVSREVIYKKDVKKTFENIQENELFNQDVIITTAILDNGINIKDERVRNIVISAYDKIEFIQMLGRQRIKEGEKVNLYIRVFPKKTFLGLIRYTEKNIQFMLNFEIPNKYTGKKQNLDIINERLTSMLLSKHPSGLLDKNPNYRGKNSTDQTMKDNSLKVYYELVVNRFAFMKLVSLRYYYRKIVDAFKNDDNAFLKLQLSWLGKEYSEKNWIHHQETEICLEKLIGKELDKKAQEELREYMQIIMKRRKLPGKKMINEYMDTHEYNYEIISSRKRGKTFWKIEIR